MAQILMLSRVDLLRGDTVRYYPKHADRYRGEVATVEEIIDASESGMSRLSPFKSPYWVKANFGGVMQTFNAQSFVIEEFRHTYSIR